MTPAEREEILRTFPSSAFPETDLLPLLRELDDIGGLDEPVAVKAIAAIRFLMTEREEAASVLDETYGESEDETAKLQARIDELEANEDAADVEKRLREAAEAVERIRKEADLARNSMRTLHERVIEAERVNKELKARKSTKALAEMTEKYKALLALWEE